MAQQLPLPWVMPGARHLAHGLGWHTLLGAIWSVLSWRSMAHDHAQALLLLLVILVSSVSGAGDNWAAVVWMGFSSSKDLVPARCPSM